MNLYGVRRALNAAASIAKQASLSEAADKGRGALRAGSGCSDMGIGSKIKHTANDVKDMVPGLGKIRAPDHLDDGEHDPENNKYVGEAGGSAADKGGVQSCFHSTGWSMFCARCRYEPAD